MMMKLCIRSAFMRENIVGKSKKLEKLKSRVLLFQLFYCSTPLELFNFSLTIREMFIRKGIVGSSGKALEFKSLTLKLPASNFYYVDLLT